MYRKMAEIPEKMAVFVIWSEKNCHQFSTFACRKNGNCHHLKNHGSFFNFIIYYFFIFYLSFIFKFIPNLFIFMPSSPKAN